MLYYLGSIAVSCCIQFCEPAVPAQYGSPVIVYAVPAARQNPSVGVIKAGSSAKSNIQHLYAAIGGTFEISPDRAEPFVLSSDSKLYPFHGSIISNRSPPA